MSGVEQRVRGAISRITGTVFGARQSAVVRVGFSLTWLAFLIREFPHRQELYGPEAPWSWSMAHEFIRGNGAFTALMWTDAQVWFEVVYALAMVSAALLLVGWHTRAMSVLFMLGVLSLENRSIFMSDGGDNVLHVMSIYLVLTRCGRVWSLDARRERRAAAARAGGGRPSADAGPVLWGVLGLALLVLSFEGTLGWGWLLVLWGLWVGHGLWWAAGRWAPDGEPRLLLDIVATLAHNAGLVVIMAEACLIYATAGWYKIQGGRWEDGTAVYYPLHLDYFSPWPALSDALGAFSIVVLLITYGTVIAQVAFPFTLFNRKVKNVLLVIMMCEHLVIAITLGLPFFSMAMIAADAVFLPTAFLTWAGRTVLRTRDRLAPPGRRGAEPQPGGGAAEAVPGPAAPRAGAGR
ncbi:HTTM domain-containing protein [Streptomyces sp. NPDC050560]|uniref:HTTM domain-containing protein n=1 Tax=Streptomyces sp. NPDC050560 TaxID=3365630 RepID=UPI00378EF94D